MKSMAQPDRTAEILRRLTTLRADSPRQWGRMTAHQMICHLNDSARVALGERVASPATSIIHRTLVKWLALYLPFRWPPGVPTRPEIDQHAGGTCPTTFDADRAELQALTERLLVEDLAGRAHPIFGPMSRSAWLRWAYLHMDHHLRQFGV
jgi:hypothetical protein